MFFRIFESETFFVIFCTLWFILFVWNFRIPWKSGWCPWKRPDLNIHRGQCAFHSQVEWRKHLADFSQFQCRRRKSRLNFYPGFQLAFYHFKHNSRSLHQCRIFSKRFSHFPLWGSHFTKNIKKKKINSYCICFNNSTRIKIILAFLVDLVEFEKANRVTADLR